MLLHSIFLYVDSHGCGGRLGRFLDECCRRRVKIAAADGAGLVRFEPEIDALLVEDVVANGQEPEEAVVFELHKANGALEAVLVLFADIFHAGVDESRERFYESRVKAVVAGDNV